MSELIIEQFQIVEGARMTVYRGRTDSIVTPGSERQNRRSVAATVELDVDGQHDVVYLDAGAYGDLETLDRLVATIGMVREELAGAYHDQQPVGRCFAIGEWASCSNDSGHAGAHNFGDAPKDYPMSDEERKAARTTPWEGSPVY